MDMILIKENSIEWDFMWEWLENHPINESIENPKFALNNNETWQYIGSYRQEDKVISEFRHRCHPKNNNVVKLSINHQNKLNDEQINKVIKIK